MGQRSRLEPGDDIVDRAGTIHEDNELAKGVSVEVRRATTLDQPEPHPSRSRPAGARQWPPPFRVQRIFALPVRLMESARSAAASAVARAAPRGRARAWVPRCKTGGVAYAVAMLLADAARESSTALKLAVFGTDVDEEALDMARAGRYPARAALDMDSGWRGQYTFDERGAIRVSERLRRDCIFSRHHLHRDPPMIRVDLLVCQRVFDGMPRARRGELAERFHFALREGGSLLALDHIESYPDALFERVAAGHLVARGAPKPRRASSPPLSAGATGLSGRALVRVDRGLARGWEALPAARSSGSPQADGGRVVATLGMPLLLCDSSLRVIYSSREVAEDWGLSAGCRGLPLDAISARLPGGAEIASAARRALVGRDIHDVVVRDARRMFIARVCAADDPECVSILFSAVTPADARATHAIQKRHELATLARLGRLARTGTVISAVYEEALGAALAVVPGCSSGVIMIGPPGAGELEIAASQGLGGDPRSRLDELPGARELVAMGLEQGVELRPPQQSSMGSHAASSNRAALAAPDVLAGAATPGIASPIFSSGRLVGVLAVFGHCERGEQGARDFMASIAACIGDALVRDGVQARISLELEVGALLAGASTLDQVGAGLLGALSASGVDQVGIAIAAGVHRWRQIYPSTTGEDVLALGPAEVAFVAGACGGELLITAGGSDGDRCLLRLTGKSLKAADAEQARGLRRVAELVAVFLGRWRSSAVVCASEPPQRQHSPYAEWLDKALYDALPVGVSIHDSAGALRAVNARLAALGAGSSSAPPGSASEGGAMLQRLYQGELPSWVARVLATGEPIFDVELSLTAAAETRYWLCNLAPVRCQEGELRGAVVVVQEISALKRVEAALREVDRQKDNFLALLGHELRNPMAAIRNATELLGRVQQPTPQLLRLKSIFDRQTAQTAKLIDGLLDIARVTRGKVELQRAPLELVDLVRQSVGDRSKQFEGRQLHLLMPEARLWVDADRVRLIQILDNLISNALKFTRQQGCIRIELRRVAAQACLRVEDDGEGIEPELLPQIFEPFRQGRSMTSQGLGLGLALVKGLCELHGFSLSAHSGGAGRGACFQIQFPLVTAPDASAPESRVDARRLDILLLEDNEDVAETLAELLAGEGHRVDVVGSAERGLERLRERAPDVVLSDIGLPGMDGLAFARRVRHDSALSNIKLVALTGFGDAASESRIKAAGFERCLIKPVRLEALRTCLARMAVR